MKCVLIFSTMFVWNICYSKNSARHYRECTNVFMWCAPPAPLSPLFLWDFNETWISSTDFRKLLNYQISLIKTVWEPGGGGGRTDMTQLMVAFRNFANASKNTHVCRRLEKWPKMTSALQKCRYFKYLFWELKNLKSFKIISVTFLQWSGLVRWFPFIQLEWKFRSATTALRIFQYVEDSPLNHIKEFHTSQRTQDVCPYEEKPVNAV